MGGAVIGRALGKKMVKASAPSAPSSSPSTAAAKGPEEDMEATVETAGDGMNKKRRGKRGLRTGVTQAAGTNVGGEGASGLQIPKG